MSNLLSESLEAVGAVLTREALRARPSSLWRYRELLPYEDEERVVSLGEGLTALLDCPRLAAEFGVERPQI